MCFTPEVTAATCAIEIVLALWTWTQYRMTRIGRLATGLLLLLAAYQFTELMICVGDGQFNDWWGRIGFVVITFLPIIGIHIASLIEGELAPRGQQQSYRIFNKLIPYFYALAIVISGAFVLSPTLIADAQCSTSYIRYHYTPLLFVFYGTYYTVFVATGFIYFVSLLNRTKGPALQACLWTSIGYLSFVVPTFIVTSVFPYMNIGFPSVLCGFAIFFAIILVTKVLPLAKRAKLLK